MTVNNQLSITLRLVGWKLKVCWRY